MNLFNYVHTLKCQTTPFKYCPTSNLEFKVGVLLRNSSLRFYVPFCPQLQYANEIFVNNEPLALSQKVTCLKCNARRRKECLYNQDCLFLSNRQFFTQSVCQSVHPSVCREMIKMMVSHLFLNVFLHPERIAFSLKMADQITQSVFSRIHHRTIRSVSLPFVFCFKIETSKVMSSPEKLLINLVAKTATK